LDSQSSTPAVSPVGSPLPSHRAHCRTVSCEVGSGGGGTNGSPSLCQSSSNAVASIITTVTGLSSSGGGGFGVASLVVSTSGPVSSCANNTLTLTAGSGAPQTLINTHNIESNTSFATNTDCCSAETTSSLSSHSPSSLIRQPISSTSPPPLPLVTPVTTAMPIAVATSLSIQMNGGLMVPYSGSIGGHSQQPIGSVVAVSSPVSSIPSASASKPSSPLLNPHSMTSHYSPSPYISSK
ncbi:unnamed protein product, partial [Protopolystoma xenopodis]